MGISVLRRVGAEECVQQLWNHAREHDGVAGAPCPECQRKMIEVAVPLVRGPLRLDVCTGCEFIWFDPRVFEQFPPSHVGGPRQLPEKTREALAVAEVRRIGAEEEKEIAVDAGDGPDEAWEWIPAMLGLPVKENAPELSCWPWMTWGLAAALVIVYALMAALTAAHRHAIVEELGLVPAHLWRHDGITLVTNFFLHAGFFHLLGNVYFLLVFGDNVEDDLGRWRFAALLALSALFGNLLHVAGNPHSDLPCIGASGGISGVVTYYALRFPQARMGLLFRYFFLYFRWVHLPAAAFLLLWLALQCYYVIEEHFGEGNIAALAHLGGAAMGVVAWAMWHARNQQRILAREDAQGATMRD